MPQRQFRGDDTSVWPDRFGTGVDGALTVSADTTDSTANTTITGTSGSTTATVGSSSGFSNGNLVWIHFTQGTGSGVWELNKISNISGTTWTMAYSLTNTYSTASQVFLLKQYTTATIDATKTVTVNVWDTGDQRKGIYAILANQSIIVNGSISSIFTDSNSDQASAGFRAGSNRQTGESQLATAPASTGANGGAGRGQNTDNSSGGGGASYATSGTSGGGGSGAAAGSTYGQANLVVMHMGSGGGGAGGIGATHPGWTGRGGGIIMLIAPTITINPSTGSINCNGAKGNQPTNADGGGGGGGTGGSVLLKGQNISIGTNLITATGGAAGNGNGGAGQTGGAGGDGRIHVDYSATFSGSSNPTIDSSQDGVFADAGGSFLFNIM